MNKPALVVIFVTILFVSAHTQGTDIYQWTDESGVIHFSDQPPKDTNISSEVTTSAGHEYTPENDPVHANFPPSTGDEISESGENDLNNNETVKYPKVELYSTSWCKYCTKARIFFKSGNIPFTEYDIEKDKEAARRMKMLTSRNGVPFVVIGSRKIQGYTETGYLEALKSK